MRGWHHQSYRHSLSARGIKTKAVIIDIDGTIYDVTKRLNKALEHNKLNSHKFWNEFMDPRRVPLDRPVPGAKSTLKAIPKDVEKIYVSGRRNNLLDVTRKELKKNGFPEGTVILRPKNYRTEQWKGHIIKNITKNHKVLVGIGDTSEDMKNYEKHGVPGVKVTSNRKWSEKIVNRIKRLVKK